jgi:NAD(P)-dependent dehydrogenase (short-subunit alcohol dehydrogenase family)
MVAELPEGKASYVCGDISKEEDAKRMVDETVAKYGSLDILVNNAGIDPAEYADKIDLDMWRSVIDININGTFYMIHFALPVMMAQKSGVVVNIASLAGIRNIPAMTAYSTTKGGMISMSGSIALDYGKHGIRSNCIAPGATVTPMMQKTSGDWEEQMSILTRFLPLARPAMPEEIAQTALFLASDDSGYITGQVIAVEGGACVVDPCGVATIDKGQAQWG